MRPPAREPVTEPATDSGAAPSAPRGVPARAVLVIALAVALFAGVAGAGLGTMLTADPAGHADPGPDARVAAACEILERHQDDLPLSPGALSVQESLLYELSAAGNLFLAAGISGTDEAGDVLRTSGRDLVLAGNTLDLEEVNGSAERLWETACV